MENNEKKINNFEQKVISLSPEQNDLSQSTNLFSECVFCLKKLASTLATPTKSSSSSTSTSNAITNEQEKKDIVVIGRINSIVATESSKCLSLHLCGHAAHYTCLTRFLKQESQNIYLQQSFCIAQNGEFLCPLCRRFCNTTLPLSLDLLPNKLAENNESFSDWINRMKNIKISNENNIDEIDEIQTIWEPLLLSTHRVEVIGEAIDQQQLFWTIADLFFGTLCRTEMSFRFSNRQTEGSESLSQFAKDCLENTLKRIYLVAVKSPRKEVLKEYATVWKSIFTPYDEKKENLDFDAKSCMLWCTNLMSNELNGFSINANMSTFFIVSILKLKLSSFTPELSFHLRTLFAITVWQSNLICKTQLKNDGVDEYSLFKSLCLPFLRRCVLFVSVCLKNQSCPNIFDDFANLCNYLEIPLIEEEDISSTTSLFDKLNTFYSDSNNIWNNLMRKWANIVNNALTTCYPYLSEDEKTLIEQSFVYTNKWERKNLSQNAYFYVTTRGNDEESFEVRVLCLSNNLRSQSSLIKSDPSLMVLPKTYDELFFSYRSKPCATCKKNHDKCVLCLVCGTVLGANCWTDHSEKCTIAIFIILNTTTTLFHREHRLSVWRSFFVDSHGEEDLDLKRGRPLYLNNKTYQYIQHLWRTNEFDSTSEFLHPTFL
eukprot:c21886_g1_i1.p1 GENE.c21886_g1_i1~~c21886_g1_i1.p1  ORF type:complete len:717 (+),score=217.88 c21886_g1_i1:182-2152(+)